MNHKLRLAWLLPGQASEPEADDGAKEEEAQSENEAALVLPMSSRGCCSGGI